MRSMPEVRRDLVRTDAEIAERLAMLNSVWQGMSEVVPKEVEDKSPDRMRAMAEQLDHVSFVAEHTARLVRLFLQLMVESDAIKEAFKRQAHNN